MVCVDERDGAGMNDPIMFLPAWVVGLLSLTTAIGLFREASKKKARYYKLRWCGIAALFLEQAITYFWVVFFDPSADLRAFPLRIGNTSIVLLATIYFSIDAANDFRVYWRRKHAN